MDSKFVIAIRKQQTSLQWSILDLSTTILTLITHDLQCRVSTILQYVGLVGVVVVYCRRGPHGILIDWFYLSSVLELIVATFGEKVVEPVGQVEHREQQREDEPAIKNKNRLGSVVTQCLTGSEATVRIWHCYQEKQFHVEVRLFCTVHHNSTEYSDFAGDIYIFFYFL